MKFSFMMLVLSVYLLWCFIHNYTFMQGIDHIVLHFKNLH